jgi:peptide/nickel transport system permease protein
MVDEQLGMTNAASPVESPVTAAGQEARGPRRFGLMPALPIAVLLTFLLVGILAPLLTPFNPVRNDLINSLLPPAWLAGGSPAHLLGTDSFGRDVLARLMYGARISFSVAAFSLVIALGIGIAAGVAAGYRGGAIDSALMRLTDMVLAVPTILIALAIGAILGPSFINLVLILGALTWPRMARLVRGETLLLKKYDYVGYAGAIGVPGWVIILRHVLPNVLPTIMVVATLEIGNVILNEASLSFLGAGLPPPTASWGVMISDGRALIATGWWIALFPGLAITATVVACNALGNWLRDYLDPKTRLA